VSDPVVADPVEPPSIGADSGLGASTSIKIGRCS
jgi:hypothetical protein